MENKKEIEDILEFNEHSNQHTQIIVHNEVFLRGKLITISLCKKLENIILVS